MGNDEYLKNRGSGQYKKDSDGTKEQRQSISAMIPRDDVRMMEVVWKIDFQSRDFGEDRINFSVEFTTTYSRSAIIWLAACDWSACLHDSVSWWSSSFSSEHISVRFSTRPSQYVMSVSCLVFSSAVSFIRWAIVVWRSVSWVLIFSSRFSMTFSRSTIFWLAACCWSWCPVARRTWSAHWVSRSLPTPVSGATTTKEPSTIICCQQNYWIKSQTVTQN